MRSSTLQVLIMSTPTTLPVTPTRRVRAYKGRQYECRRHIVLRTRKFGPESGKSRRPPDLDTVPLRVPRRLSCKFRGYSFIRPPFSSLSSAGCEISKRLPFKNIFSKKNPFTVVFVRIYTPCYRDERDTLLCDFNDPAAQSSSAGNDVTV